MTNAIQKLRRDLIAWGKKHKDNPAISEHAELIAGNLKRLNADPHPPLIAQTNKNIKELEEMLVTTGVEQSAQEPET